MPAHKGSHNRANGKIVLDSLRKHAVQEDWKSLREGAAKIWQAYANGEQWAVNYIADRFDGKAHQTSEVTINRVNSLEDLPTHELERIAFGSGQDTSEAASGEQEHRPVH